MAVIQKLCKQIAEKIRDEKLYPADIIKTVEGLKPSEEFVNFVSEAFSKFARKCNQDVFLARFYGEIYKNWKRFFPASENQIAVNVLFIHFPQKLIAYHKQASTDEAPEVYYILIFKNFINMVGHPQQPETNYSRPRKCLD